MPQKKLPKQVLLAKANRRRPVGRPRTRWTNCIKDLEWNRLGIYPSKMMKVIEEREMRQLNLQLLLETWAMKRERRKKRKKELEIEAYRFISNLPEGDLTPVDTT